MKALLASALPILALVGFYPSGSAFRGVEGDEAALITGGACYNIVSFGCQKVINQLPDGTYITDGTAGCDDSASGNNTTTANDAGFSSSGKGRWCSFWHTWSCGIYVNERPYCAQPNPTPN